MMIQAMLQLTAAIKMERAGTLPILVATTSHYGYISAGIVFPFLFYIYRLTSFRTDTFFVEWQYEYTEWENKGMDIDCATTSDCNRQAVELSQSCETNTVTWNNKGQIALQAKLDTFWKKLGGGAELQYAHEWGGNEAKTTCTSNSQSGRCTWNDQECHAFWAAKRNIRIHGYSRRSCTTGRSEYFSLS